MARSQKKGVYVEANLLKRVKKLSESGSTGKVVRTASRSSTVVPSMVGHTIAIHNGKEFVPVYISEQMVGHKLGEFSMTRTFKGHAGDRKGKKGK